MMKELRIPMIYQNGDYIGYGGNQDWFGDKWAQKAGCASVLASNMYAYYIQKDCFELEEFLRIMKMMVRYMTPGRMGYPFLYKFARTFVKIMAKDELYLKPLYQKKSKNHKHALSFVLEALNNEHPVGMLILHHRAKELEDDNWHWICISGYIEKENGYDLIFSDCGQRRIIDARVLLDTDYHNVFKMVRMEKDPTK